MFDDFGRALLASKPPIAPADEFEDEREEVQSLLRKLIFPTRRLFLIEALAEHAEFNQTAQPISQDVRRHAERLLEVCEALPAEKR